MPRCWAACSWARPRSGRATSPTSAARSAPSTPDRGIDFDYFTDTFADEGGKLADRAAVLPRPHRQLAADRVGPGARTDDRGEAQGRRGDHRGLLRGVRDGPAALQGRREPRLPPEWFFPGANSQDIEITARILNGIAPEQMKHVFGIGTLLLIVDGFTDPVVRWFDWYWSPTQGVYAPAAVGTLRFLYGGVHMGGPEAHAEDVPPGPVLVPAQGGAADNQVQSFMNGYGPSVGLPYDEHSAVGLDFALMWWNPDEVGLGKILFDEGTGKFMYPNNAKRYSVDAVEERRARSSSTRATRSRSSPSSLRPRRRYRSPTARVAPARAVPRARCETVRRTGGRTGVRRGRSSCRGPRRTR